MTIRIEIALNTFGLLVHVCDKFIYRKPYKLLDYIIKIRKRETHKQIC